MPAGGTVTGGSQRGNARGRESRRRLVAAAGGCFAEHGWAGTRVTDVADAAGMSHGAFYRHFTDKRDVFLEAVAVPVAALLEVVEGHPAFASPTVDEDAIAAMNLAFFRAYAEHRELVRVLRDAAAAREDGLAQRWIGLRGAFVSAIGSWLGRLRDAGAIRPSHPDDLDVLADALGSVVEQLAYVRIGMAEPPPDDAGLRALARTSGSVWFGALSLRA